MSTLKCLVLLLFVICYRQIDNCSFKTEDMIELNENYYLVQEGLEAGEKQKKLEQQYDCKLIFSQDEDYTARLYEAISQQDPVFDYFKGETLAGKIIFSRNAELFSNLKNRMMKIMCLFLVSVLILFDLFCVFLYIRVIRPFQKLKKFATNIALGELDAPLERNKNNYFGEFTESFDIMREELKAAREGEYQANLSKRELVASLSHDIKTPVSTIKALCEILQIKLNLIVSL